MLNSYYPIGKKNPINNQVTYPSFIAHEFIDFSESIWIYSFFSQYIFDNTVREKN